MARPNSGNTRSYKWLKYWSAKNNMGFSGRFSRSNDTASLKKVFTLDLSAKIKGTEYRGSLLAACFAASKHPIAHSSSLAKDYMPFLNSNYILLLISPISTMI